jgi:hypothetical protein
VDCVVELVRQPLFATRGVKLREVESDEIRPVDFVHACQLVFEVGCTIAYSRSVLDSSGCRYTGSLCVTALGAVCTSVAIAISVWR